VSYVCALGYRAEEYAMFGRDMKGRGRRFEVCLDAIRRALRGESFEFEGRPVRVTPRPFTPGGPPIFIGGGSAAAARRAGRLGLGMLAQGGDASLGEVYRAACAEAGHAPGLFIQPRPGTAMSAFVAEDPDRAWREMGPYLLHDARMYAAWLGSADAGSKSVAGDVAALRAENGSYRIFTPGEAVAYLREYGVLLTQPLCGGLPPDLAWTSLALIAGKVMPALATAGS
jgi:alkanesulfonate monooxygenase SsuD/methylene tetrahydromethanopterin reductase-like flavin-dependent oxidoreductase (luciferase family)